MTCLVCEYTTAAGLYLCNQCDARFRAVLDRVSATLRTAQATLSNMSVQPRVGSAGTSAPGAPLNLDMAERLGEYERRLTELAHWVNGREEPNRLRIFTTTFHSAEYLRAMATHLRKRDYVADIYLELRGLERRVLSAADRPLVKRPLGECGALNLNTEGTVTRCDGIVEGHETATTGRCKECHREHDLTDRITERFAEAWHHVAPLAVVVRALKDAGYPIKYATARQWVHRGKLHPRCDLKTRQEGHSPAEVLKVLQTSASTASKICA
ncbi:hypothetical protein [Glutamicibacter sp. AOP5-A2-18]|uniref:hypothetical protein n=1 Tax=Glutamicibacter sp. AOP5-A2-18 TaxID=3457656 RepID=UPI0040341E40